MRTLSERTVTNAEEEKRKKEIDKNAVNSGHCILAAMPKARVQTSLGPKCTMG